MEKFDIIMLGNTSVGKTSMLAVLNKEIRKINNIHGVSFAPCGDTIVDLDDSWNDLEAKICDGGLYRPVLGKLGQTTDYVTYHFNLSLKGESRAQVDFIDTKGSFIRDVDGSGLLEKTESAVGAFCVIDAAVLMECDAATNLRFNRPGLVADLLGKVFAREEHPKFVTFVLTKCETYMRTEEKIWELRTKFHEVYAESIELLQQKRINSYAMAIQTLGCVRFKDLVDTTDDTGRVLRLPQFVRVPGATKIESHDCEMPLVVTMKNLLWTMQSNSGIFDWILTHLGLREGLEDYIEKLSGIKNPSGLGQYYEEIASDC